jgi:hypothetical protein
MKGKIHINLPDLSEIEEHEVHKEFNFPLPNDSLKRDLKGK